MNVYEGMRIKLIEMPHDPDPIPPGTTGTVIGVTSFDRWVQVMVKWDGIERQLALCVPPDNYEVLK